nr:hypothetical protein [Tanacetum cinerariifolium]
MLAQVGNQRNVGNQNGNVVNENVQKNVGNVLVNGNRIRTLSREVDVSMSWNDFKFIMKEEFCPSHEMQKFHELARLVPHLVTLKTRKIERYVYGLAPHIRGMVAATETKTMQKDVQISSALTDEAVRNGSIKQVEKKRNVGEPSKDKNGRGNSKRTRTGIGFATIANLVGTENAGGLAKDCRGVPRNVNLVNARNPPVRACYKCEEARQDPNIVKGTFTLNEHFATTLFDSGADYSFVSTTFILLLGIEPSELGFRYEIEIANEQLVEIDKVIKGCRLEIKGHVFDIDLIPFGHGSFDVIIGMDWLFNYMAEIICHEKGVRIPLLDGKVLRVLEERPKEKVRLLMSAKASDKNLEDIVVVRDFPKVFLELS